jgi:hypothetical protein
VEVIERHKVRQPGEGLTTRPRHCSMPGCIRSASFDVVLLKSVYVPVCKKHRQIWEEGWDHALGGWPDEVEERERELAAA